MPKTVSKDTDVHVTYEDQQYINKFARVNARLQDMKDELESKRKDLQNLDDASDELLMAEDEEALIPYKVGEVFVHCAMDDTNKMLEDAKANIQKDIGDVEKKCDEHREILSELKVKLYAKFGTNINLEQEDDQQKS